MSRVVHSCPTFVSSISVQHWLPLLIHLPSLQSNTQCINSALHPCPPFLSYMPAFFTVLHLCPQLLSYVPTLITVLHLCSIPMSSISVLDFCPMTLPSFLPYTCVLHSRPPPMSFASVLHLCPPILSYDPALISVSCLCPLCPTSIHVFCFCFTLVSSSIPISLLSLLLSNTLVFLLVLHPVPLLSSDERRMILLYLRFKQCDQTKIAKCL